MLDKHQRKLLMWASVALFALNSLMLGYFGMSASNTAHSDHDTMDGVSNIALIDEKSISAPTKEVKPAKHDGGVVHEAQQHEQEKHEVAAKEPEPVYTVPPKSEEQHAATKPIEETTDHAPAAPASSPKVMRHQMVCYQSGPFASQASANKMKKAVEKLDIEVKIKKQIKREKLGYWVYLKPERSLALSRLKAEEVKTKGIKDVAVVVRSKPKYAISLGVFHNKKIAEARKRKAESLGFKPLLTTRYNSETQRWVQMKMPLDKEPSEAQWKKLLKGRKGIEIKPMECK